jgi:hypothetical protein
MNTSSFHTFASIGLRCLRWHVLLANLCWLACAPGLLLPQDAAALEGDALAPPARVGQVSLISGNVRMRVDRASAWEQAALHTPITTGSALATEAPGRAEVRVGSTALRMAQDSQLVWTEIDDNNLHIEIKEGLFALRVRMLASGQRVLLTAGDVTVQVLKPGAYRFRQVAHRARLRVWVLDGQARVAFNQQDSVLGPNQQVQVDRGVASELTTKASDDHKSFDEFADSRDKRSEVSLSLQHVSTEMTGAEALDGHGNWRDDPNHGTVWFPNNLPADWTPYRYGRWRWLAPWGWTWIDDAPWGFAPFHYGRWLFAGGRWAWVPAQLSAASAMVRPVYAPALVGFYGNAAGAVWTSAAATTPLVGWYPLAPGEIYWPPYTTQLAYARALNAASVIDFGQIQSLPSANVAGPLHRFARTAFAASALPFDAFSKMKDVTSNMIVMTPSAIAQAPLSARRMQPPQPVVSATPPARTP